MIYNRKTRRMFLKGLAGSCLAIPTLVSMLPNEARAQASVAPKRFLSFLEILIRGPFCLVAESGWSAD